MVLNFKNYIIKFNKMNRLFSLYLISLVLLMGCGKPNDPESLIPPDISGGYKIVSKLLTYAYAQDVTKKDSLLYIAQGEGGLMIVNVSDPLNPQPVSFTVDNVKGYSAKILLVDSVTYMAAGSFGVNVLNVADPLMPVVTVANLNLKPAKNSFFLGKFMYTAISELGVGIADISYPTYPDVRGTVSTPGYANDVYVTSDTTTLIVACGEMGISLINISEIVEGYGAFWEMGWCNVPGYAESLVVREDQSLAFMACGTEGLQIVNFADTSDVHIVGSFDGGGYAKELIYKDQTIFMTTELSGLHVVDVSDVANPTLIGMVDTEFALGIDMDDNYIYIADDKEGLIIISIPQ